MKLARILAVLWAAFFFVSLSPAKSPLGAKWAFSQTGTPYAYALANGTQEVYGGPVRAVGVRVYGNGATARTVDFYDSSGGHPTGGTLLGQVTIPASTGGFQVDVNWVCRHGLVAVVSGTGAYADVLIEGINPEGNPFEVGEGTVIFGGTLTPSASTRVDSSAVNTDTAYVREGTTSLRVLSANPGGSVAIEFNQGSQVGVSAIAPADMLRNVVVDLYVASPGLVFNNGTLGGTGNATVEVRLYDSAVANTYNCAVVRQLSFGWNRLIFPRNRFTAGVGSPSFASTSFPRIEVRIDAGTSTSPNLDIYLDAIRINVGGSNPAPVMIDTDDGWNPANGYNLVLAKYPKVKINSFLTRNFSELEKDKFATLAEWKALTSQYPGRVYLGWHSINHSGPTALEALTANTFTEQQITPWLTWFRSLVGASEFNGQLHAATPNGQDSLAMRQAFANQGFVTNRTIRAGVNHPWGIRANRYDLRVLDLSGSGSYPADYNAQMKEIELTTCLGIFLTHSISSEDGGSPVHGGAASLNLTPIEADSIFRDLNARAEAGLITILTRNEITKHLDMSIPGPR